MDETAAATAQRFGLGAIDQVGFVVRDLESALPGFEALFGAFRRMDAETPGTTFRGRKSDLALKLAFAQSGGVEIEIIQPVSGAGPHQEFLQAGREGPHHIRFRVADLDARLPALRAAGFEVVWHHRYSPDTAWAYVAAPGDAGGLLFELLQMP